MGLPKNMYMIFKTVNDLRLLREPLCLRGNRRLYLPLPGDPLGSRHQDSPARRSTPVRAKGIPSGQARSNTKNLYYNVALWTA